MSFKSISTYDAPDFESSSADIPYIFIGSDARLEGSNNEYKEGIFINLLEGTIHDTDSEGLVIDTAEGVKFEDLEHPELILEAWTTNAHLIHPLYVAKSYFLSKANVGTTLKLLRKNVNIASSAINTGIYRYHENDHIQHIIENDKLLFYFGYEQFGPKYGFLRFFQLASLIGVVELEQKYGKYFFGEYMNIIPSFRNRLICLETHQLINRKERMNIEKAYFTLNKFYQLHRHTRNSVQYVDVSELQDAVSLMKSILK